MFTPNYQNIVNAALNKKSERIPLYEHIIVDKFMERLSGKKFAGLFRGDYADKQEYFKHYAGFFRDMGYDTVSFECCVAEIMPGGGALGGHVEGAIKTYEDFEKYPWDGLADSYFKKFSQYFEALRSQMPEGMKAVGGVGNGVFECVQDIVGFESLCYIKSDDEDLYRALFKKVGDLFCEIWERFLPEFGDIFCVCRFGDDLGYKSSTLLPAEDISNFIVPQYKRIVGIIHKHQKPFLLHSCGCIFNVMEDLIRKVGINAKHSNEDAIAPFSKWIEDYGERIANFGGLDTDALCDVNPCDITKYTTKVYQDCEKKGHGIAIGSGNSIPNYVNIERYLKALEVIRDLRGER